MKGIIFDTDENERPGVFKEMFTTSKISCWGLDAIEKYLEVGDYVFYYQQGQGIIGAGKVVSDFVQAGDEQYCKVELLTPVLKDYSDMCCVAPKEIKKILGKNLFFATTVKKPLIQSATAIQELLNASRANYGLRSMKI
jgi:hypothetical protein